MFSEKLLQFIWQHRYYNDEKLLATTGEKLKIIFPGKINRNEGPDFLDARIKIGKLLFAGNIELHMKSSDWYHHQHEGDWHYQHLILHVVYENNLPLNDELLNTIPCLELKDCISHLLLEKYTHLMQNLNFVPCADKAAEINELVWLSWKDRLVIEKWQQKSLELSNWLSSTNNNWEAIFYWLLSRHFGLKMNATNFELLARATPMKLLAKHKHHLFQLEALLFGQAGLLKRNFKEEYPLTLQKEYAFLQSKYQLKPLSANLWKYMRLRPVNFPDVRIAQLASLIHHSSHLFSKLLELKDIKATFNLFDIKASTYWDDHYRLGHQSVKQEKRMGKIAIYNLLINTVCPLLFFYGQQRDEPVFKERAIEWLKNIPPENNRLLRNWENIGISNKNAIDSQALLYLKNNYCDEKYCLNCAIGNKFLSI